MNYNTKQRLKTIVFLLTVAVMVTVTIVLAVNLCRGEELVRCWVMCKPGSQVNVRRSPSTSAMQVGFLDAGDSFMTDSVCMNGFVRCYGIGVNGEGCDKPNSNNFYHWGGLLGYVAIRESGCPRRTW